MYVGVRSIFGSIFEQSENLSLAMRFAALEQSHGFPHQFTVSGMEAIIQFAQGELAVLALNPKTGGNPTLPLTDHQRERNKQAQDQDKKRVAAAKAQSQAQQSFESGGSSALHAPQGGLAPTANAVGENRVRTSMTTSPWSKPCNAWTAGGCQRGISCHFKHEGFPIHLPDGSRSNRCFTCGRSDHQSDGCTAPGGALDPTKDKHWEEYKQRRTQAEQKGKGKGKPNEEGGKKGKGKRKRKR